MCAAGATASQSHNRDGSVSLTFTAVLECSHAGEMGALTVQDEQAWGWQGEARFMCNAPGEQSAAVQVEPQHDTLAKMHLMIIDDELVTVAAQRLAGAISMA